MRLVARSGDRMVFHLGVRECAFLERLLSFYPLRTDWEPRLSREVRPEWAEADQLLAESHRDQGRELAAWLKRRLTEGAALERSGSGWRLSLDEGEAERLLQILNELRVGAWMKLGCPEDLNDEQWVTSPAQAPLFVIMTVAGQVQMLLLHALSGELKPSEEPEGSEDPEDA